MRVRSLRPHLARKIQPLRLAVLDVGSNTVHLAVVDGQPDGTFTPVARERETLRLAEAAFPAMLLPEEAVGRLTDTVARMRARADELRADALVGFATSAIREARNGVEALGEVQEATGVAVTVLPGAEEARLTYLAARRWTAFSARRLLVVDIGGSSLEVAAGESDRPEIAESLPLGATRCRAGSRGRTPLILTTWWRCGCMPWPCSARWPSGFALMTTRSSVPPPRPSAT
jgi:exopolyphosphatase / guanosine-5'-triphosphate,3'-diphosphate pyrophosphatase